MKKLFGKRFHRIPVLLASVLLVLVLITGGALAVGYGFFTATTQVKVVEAIAVGMGTWDNLAPYGSVDDVDIAITEDTEGNPVLTITPAAETPYVGEGFAPGEYIVFPLNIRNGSDGVLTLEATVVSDSPLVVKASYELNVGTQTDPIPSGHEGDFLAYGFEALGEFETLDGWSVVVEGNSGFSGSAVHNAQILFIKISVPGDIPIIPEFYSLTLTLERS